MQPDSVAAVNDMSFGIDSSSDSPAVAKETVSRRAGAARGRGSINAGRMFREVAYESISMHRAGKQMQGPRRGKGPGTLGGGRRLPDGAQEIPVQGDGLPPQHPPRQLRHPRAAPFPGCRGRRNGGPHHHHRWRSWYYACGLFSSILFSSLFLSSLQYLRSIALPIVSPPLMSPPRSPA